MTLPTPPSNPNYPIPNGPFYHPEGNYLQGEYGPFVVGGGIFIDNEGTISASGGAGTVTSVTGLSPIGVTDPTGNANVYILPSTTAQPGAVQLATLAEVILGTDSSKAVTSDTLATVYMPFSGGTFTGPVTFNVSPVFPPGIPIGPSCSVTYDNSVSGLTAVNVQDAITELNAIKINCSSLAAKGDILSSDGSTVTALPVGADGQALIACSACTTGLTWGPAGTVTCVATTAAFTGGPITTTGTIDLAVTGVSAATYANPVALSVDACGRITSVIDSPYLPVLRCDFKAKGDFLVGLGFNNFNQLSVGNDGDVIFACAACAQGVYWGPPAAGAAATPTVLGSVYGKVDIANNSFSLGHCALASVTSSTNNTAIGACAMCAVSDAADSGNIAVGYCALADASGIVGVTAIGNFAGAYLTRSGALDITAPIIAIGTSAMRCSGEQYSIGIGNAALENSDGNGNIAIGHLALQKNTTGYRNVVIGNGTANESTTGCSNTLIGDTMARSLSGGSGNIVVGNFATVCNLTTGSFNTVMGGGAAPNLTTGSCNTLIGVAIAQPLTTGSCNTIIGARNWSSTGFLSNITAIGSHARYAEFGASSTSWSFVSDARIKENITALDVNGESFVNTLNPVHFTLLDEETRQPADGGNTVVGFIAQDVQQSLKDAGVDFLENVIIDRGNDELLRFDATALIPFLTKAVQELSAKVKDLESRINNP